MIYNACVEALIPGGIRMLRPQHKLPLIVFVFLIIAVAAAQAQSADDPAALLDQSDAAHSNGEFQKAIDLCQSALKLYEDANDQKGIGMSLVRMITSLMAQGKIAESEKTQQRAAQIFKDIGDEFGTAQALAALAFIKVRMSDYAGAITITDQAIALAEKTGNKKALIWSLQSRGRAHQRLAEYDEALRFADRALQLAMEIQNDQFVITIRADIGIVHWIRGDFSAALESLNKSLNLAIEKNYLFYQAFVLGDRGLVYWNQGDLDGALADFEKAQVVFQNTGNKTGEAVNVLNMGIIHMNLGNYGKSQENLQRSLELAIETKDRGLEGVALDEIGKIYHLLGNNDLALDYFQKGLKISDEVGEKRAVTYALADIANVLEEKGNYKSALTENQKILKLYEEMDEKKGVAEILIIIGRLHGKLGSHELALTNHKKAFSIMESIGFKVGEGKSRLMIAQDLQSLGKLAEAEQELTAAIEVLKETEISLLWQALHGKALVCRDTNRFDESKKLLEEAAGQIEEIRADVLLSEQRSSFLEDKLVVYEDLITLLLQMGQTAEAFEYAQRSKARAFLDVLAEARIHDFIQDPEFRERKRQLVLKLTATHKQIQEEQDREHPEPEKIRKLIRLRKELDEEYSNLAMEIRNQNPRFAELQRPKILASREAQELLDQDSILLEYFSGKKNSVLFAVTRDDIRSYTLPGDENLADRIQQIRAVLQKPDPVWEESEHSYSNYKKYAADLYLTLIQPAASLLAGKQKIVIAPDGALHYLPFESLLTESAASAKTDFSKLAYFGARYEIQYVPSVSVLGAVETAQTSRGERNQLIAFADPSLPGVSNSMGSSAVREWSSALGPLPNARIEVNGISHLYKANDSLILIGPEATEKSVKTAKLDQYKMIHFASHGLIDEQNPQFSALVLGGDPKSGEDGYLTMREVFDLKLNADLVVLSACKTGLGKQIRGEGVNGLSRAFLSAGTPRVLVSLWNVYDRSTADFMINFYRNLSQNTLNHAAALKQARIEMIHSGKYSHPYYWSPFVLIGSR
jgi:CHAT domain-containing protein/tetratricopeptide (TPR) repeat protein